MNDEAGTAHERNEIDTSGVPQGMGRAYRRAVTGGLLMLFGPLTRHIILEDMEADDWRNRLASRVAFVAAAQVQSLEGAAALFEPVGLVLLRHVMDVMKRGGCEDGDGLLWAFFEIVDRDLKRGMESMDERQMTAAEGV